MESHVTRLALLRERLVAAGVDGFLVPRSDEYLGEYVAPAGERLAWLSGFTGSAGMAVVLLDRAVLFTDGRYTSQAAAQTAASLWTVRHLTEEPPADWLRANAPAAQIGYDPWLHSEAALGRLTQSGPSLVPLAANPIDALWQDRPAPPTGPAWLHAAQFAGIESSAKRTAIADGTACLLTDPHSVAWLLNLRGSDLAHTPLVLAFALLHADASVTVFTEAPARLPDLGPGVTAAPRDALPAALVALHGHKLRLDPEATPARLAAMAREAGVEIVPGDDPCRLPRACKNPVEQEGARLAQAKDAVALTRFLSWFAREAPKGTLTEMAAAAQLLDLRRQVPGFTTESFPAISGAGENGAIVHYRATAASDRRIGHDEAYLIDSGGQYPEGTTDVTRTLWTGPGAAPATLRARYTAVLRGHVALGTLRFPEGVAGPHLDALARRPLWDAGLDYDHGTGHGIGSFLSVHEGPASISRAAKLVALKPGMILSNEPGYYLPGAYGIRIENLLLLRAAPSMPDQTRPFLEFETLTLAPYCRALIEAGLLTIAERDCINTYHARVMATIGPQMDASDRAWLAAETAPF